MEIRLLLLVCLVLFVINDVDSFIFGRRRESRRRRAVINCSWDNWRSFGRCSASCGGGLQTRTRSVKTNSNSLGKPCPGSNVEVRKCNIGCCPSDCVLGEWEAYGHCSSTCGGGSQERIRPTIVVPTCGGKSCESTKESRDCNTQCCPVHCRWGGWGEFGNCSRSCGLGIMTRSRSVTVSESCGGENCVGPTIDSRSCNTECCPVPCSLSSWGVFGTCSLSCGNGLMTRYRSMAVSPQCGGSACNGSMSEQQSCNSGCCPVDCRWEEWSGFDDCSQTCGGGETSRSRSVLVAGSCEGQVCEGPSTEVKECNTHCCPVDCMYGSWNAFEPCSVSCGGGQRRRLRSIDVVAECGGLSCFGPDTEIEQCNTDCCPIDCSYSEWGDFSSCSTSCGVGEMARYRHIEVSGMCGGLECDGSMTESVNCSTQCCPVDCSWSDWGEFGDCSETCGMGDMRRSREILTPSSCGGDECIGQSVDVETCNDRCCPVDCTYGEWSEFGDCSHTCGGGFRVRTRDIETIDSCGGDECDELPFDSQPCNMELCPIDCRLTEWQEWSDCSMSCQSGFQTRVRFTVGPFNGGQSCEEELSMNRPCNNDVCCPLDCEVGEWGEWTDCSTTCGLGQQHRSRNVAVDADCGGENCTETLQETRACNVTCCPVDCSWGEWSEFTDCNQDCEGGSRSRNRTVDLAPSCGGDECSGNATEIEECGDGCCPENCQVSEWSQWSGCSEGCGDEGAETRIRRVEGLSSCGGIECSDTEMLESRACPRVCQNGGILNENECFCPLGRTALCCQAETFVQCDMESPPVRSTSTSTATSQP